MSKKTLMISLLLMASIFIYSEAFSAWTQAKGHAYNQLTFSYYKSTKRYTTIQYDENDVYQGIGDVYTEDAAKFTAFSITYYGEYGVTNKLTVFTSVPWKRTDSEDTKRYAGERGPSGIGDIDLGLRYKLSDNLKGTGWLMSVQGAVKIPEAYDYGNPLTHLSLGDGQYDITGTLLFGRTFAKYKGYVVVSTGYKYRFENNEYYSFKPSDQIKLFIGGGYAFEPKVSLRWTIDWTKSVGNASVSQELLVDSYKYGILARSDDHVLIRETLNLESDVLNVGVGLAYNITQNIQTVLSFNMDVDGFGWFESKDAGKGRTYSLALVYMF